jgi:hypothetical protein
MTVNLELWHLITLLIAFFGCVAGFGKLLLAQVETRLQERFTAQDTARKEGQETLRKTLDVHLDAERTNAQALQALEREFLKWQADMPLHYVRREDYVRGQTVIEAKLDALYNKLEVVQLKGAQHVA